MEKRKLNRGDILLNLHAGYETRFVYLGQNSRMAYGVAFTNVNGEIHIRKSNYYTETLREEESFPVIGHINVQKMWENAVRNGTTPEGQALRKSNYSQETGHRHV